MQGLPDASGQVILLRPGQDEQFNFRMKQYIIKRIHFLYNIKILVLGKIRPGFVIDRSLNLDTVFAEPMPKPADSGSDFNNVFKIRTKPLQGSYEFIG